MKRIAKKYGYCANISDNEVEQKVNEFFLQNLDNTSKIELIRHNVFTVSDMLIYITRMEETIIQFEERKGK